MLHVDPCLMFDPRVRRLTGNAELLFYRALMFAALTGQTAPWRVSHYQLQALRFDLLEFDEYGGANDAGLDDVKRYARQIEHVELWTMDGDLDAPDYVFAPGLAEVCFVGKQIEKQPESKTGAADASSEKQVDPGLSEKRRAAGRKGGRPRKQPAQPEPVFMLRSPHEEDVA